MLDGFGLDLGQFIQGGCGLVALYLAIQVRSLLANHEIRITSLESKRTSSSNRLANRKRLGK